MIGAILAAAMLVTVIVGSALIPPQAPYKATGRVLSDRERKRLYKLRVADHYADGGLKSPTYRDRVARAHPRAEAAIARMHAPSVFALLMSGLPIHPDPELDLTNVTSLQEIARVETLGNRAEGRGAPRQSRRRAV